MAWTTPKTFDSTMVTTAILNTQIRDNFLELSTHVHNNSAGEGSSTLSGISLASQNYIPYSDSSANPATAGTLQRNGNNLLYYGSALKQLTANAAAGTASPRSLGTGATQAAAGNHTH